MSKTCGDCKHYFRTDRYEFCNEFGGQTCEYREVTPNSCCFEPKVVTVFDHITQSVETLAEKLVYIIVSEEDTSIRGWTSNVVESVFETYVEALTATIEGLKKEATEKDSQRLFKYISSRLGGTKKGV